MIIYQELIYIFNTISQINYNYSKNITRCLYANVQVMNIYLHSIFIQIKMKSVSLKQNYPHFDRRHRILSSKVFNEYICTLHN